MIKNQPKKPKNTFVSAKISCFGFRKKIVSNSRQKLHIAKLAKISYSMSLELITTVTNVTSQSERVGAFLAFLTFFREKLQKFALCFFTKDLKKGGKIWPRVGTCRKWPQSRIAGGLNSV
jgi:hypothetical protein